LNRWVDRCEGKKLHRKKIWTDDLAVQLWVVVAETKKKSKLLELQNFLEFVYSHVQYSSDCVLTNILCNELKFFHLLQKNK